MNKKPNENMWVVSLRDFAVKKRKITLIASNNPGLYLVVVGNFIDDIFVEFLV